LLLSAGACSTASAAVDRYLSADAGGAEQQTRRASLLLSIDGTDRRTDGPLHEPCCAGNVNNGAGHQLVG